MLSLQNVLYIHPNRDVLFSDIHLTVNKHQRTALIGNNGIGKSTLLRIIAGELQPADGIISFDHTPYFVPQIFGQFDRLTVAQALRIEHKLAALNEIMGGNTSQEYFDVLNDDWTIEQRCREALSYWKLNGLELSQQLGTLSGGEKTKVFLAGIFIHRPQLILLDEPSNHLDGEGRRLLYDFVQATKSSLLVVSHDRTLLNLLDTVLEMSKQGIKVYGGNYQFYKEQNQIECDALNQDIQSREKALKNAKEKERETSERQQKLDNRGKAKQEQAGVARIMMNTLRNKAENSTSKLRSVHAEKIEGISKELRELRSHVPDVDKIKFGFDSSVLHKGKILFRASGVNFAYGTKPLWTDQLNCQITSGERIALKGANGSGKTTLIKLILGKLEPQSGTVYRAETKCVYIDQDYNLIVNGLSVYDQAQQFNTSALQEHEVKLRLKRFLFSKEDWNKSCGSLSGGERMRLLLCCLTIGNVSPDMIIFDEPTNNLDIQNVEILTAAINEYQGTIIVVSHDETFLEQIGIGGVIGL